MPITVKALQKEGPDKPFKVVEIERRDPRPDDVVIAIKAAGICHSDIHTRISRSPSVTRSPVSSRLSVPR